MCGFSGMLSSFKGNSNLNIVGEMTSAIAHRGPNDLKVVEEGRITLGHCRLSILDLSESGSQPMRLEETGLILVYNGEIYNHHELRRSLIVEGHRFRGSSDTEVILHVYQAWGLDGLKKLEGIFSLALWVGASERLVLMRDRLGAKPLYFAKFQNKLIFGSEIKALLKCDGLDRSINDQALREYLWYGNSYGKRTFYNGIESLLPGHWLIVDSSGIRNVAWWKIEDWAKEFPKEISFEDGVTMLREKLGGAVQRQLSADVDVGLFLSGGVDSSAIAASIADDNRDKIKSYACGFGNLGNINELPKAELVAKHLRLDHHSVVINEGELEAAVIQMAKAHDEPFADAANIPLYLLCKNLDPRIKVVLQGDGGDEVFGGYRRYSLLHHSWLWKMIPTAISKAGLKFGPDKIKRICRIADAVGASDSASRMSKLMTTESIVGLPENIFLTGRRAELENTTDPFLEYKEAGRRFSKFDPVQQMLLTDLTVQLPSQFLSKVDRSTMAVGIEARVPLIDEAILKFSIAMPTEWKVNGFQKKIILREALRGKLPDIIIDGPKTGFGVPYGQWLSEPLQKFAKERILDDGFCSKFSLDKTVVERMLLKHQRMERDHGSILWKVLNLQVWSAECNV